MKMGTGEGEREIYKMRVSVEKYEVFMLVYVIIFTHGDAEYVDNKIVLTIEFQYIFVDILYV